MTAEEAIEELTEERNEHHSLPTDTVGQAEQLGIEALGRILGYRAYSASLNPNLLPSETED